MTGDRAQEHLDRFNAAVVSGDWSALLATLAPDAVMTFPGLPMGPFAGRDRIAEAYVTQPPDDTMRIVAVRTDGGTDVISFAWTRGGTGTLTVDWSGAGITALRIDFDQAAPPEPRHP
jgi:steroid Delta-isomerase